MARTALIALVIVCCGVAGSRAAPAHAGGFVVDSPADAVDAAPGDGVCATSGGACTLRAAVQEANALAGPDGILVPAGEYVLALTGANEDAGATGDLDITDGLTLSGSHADSATIDAAGLDRVFDIDPLLTGIDVEISGLTIRGGDSPEGGGIRSAATLALHESDIVANHATVAGGIANRSQGSIALTNVSVRENTASTAGGLQNSGEVMADNVDFAGNASGDDGGAAVNFGTFSAAHSTFRDNTSGDNGGAFWGDGALTLTDSSLTDNVAADEGGAIVSFGGNVTLTRTNVQGNRADRLRGGALVNFGASTMTLVETAVHNNTAVTSGGGILNNGTLTLERSSVARNTAGGSGGAIHGDAGASLTLINTTVAENRSAPGGGAIANGGDATIRYSTIAYNVGDGLNNTGTVHVGSTIIAKNDDVNCTNRIIASEGYNMSETRFCDFQAHGDLNFVDPLLEPLVAGATVYYPLQPDSPAIDHAGPTCPATDQRGVARPQGGGCDIGAYEVEVAWPAAGDANGDGRIDSVDAALVLQYTAGLLATLPQPGAADVNGDGRVDSIDATLILQFAAGLLDGLPA